MFKHIILYLCKKLEVMSVIKSIQPLYAGPWPTLDPFLFCAYHLDHYPQGNEGMGPDKGLLRGRNMGQDFQNKDGWNMYHGSSIPGFPAHPHRGFETVTIAEIGMADHSDSMGATGRFGNGDVQWLTAGKGVQHAEMFPLLETKKENPLKLFQIWLNLPRKSKMVAPHYKMLWNEDIPVVRTRNLAGAQAQVKIIIGSYDGVDFYNSTPDSWAANPDNGVQIMLITLEPGATFEMPAAKAEFNRALFFYEGDDAFVNGKKVDVQHRVELAADQKTSLVNGDAPSQFLYMQGKPIGEPVAQYGPFVMNTEQEIHEAMADFQQTQFGGWPWNSTGPVNPKTKGRFALFADGTVEEK